jgi:histone H3/H4
MVKMSEFSVSTLIRIIRKSAKVRVSRDAAVELGAVLEDYLAELSKEALKISKKRGAKTLSKKDVKEAAEILTK